MMPFHQKGDEIDLVLMNVRQAYEFFLEVNKAACFIV